MDKLLRTNRNALERQSISTEFSAPAYRKSHSVNVTRAAFQIHSPPGLSFGAERCFRVLFLPRSASSPDLWRNDSSLDGRSHGLGAVCDF